MYDSHVNFNTVDEIFLSFLLHLVRLPTSSPLLFKSGRMPPWFAMPCSGITLS